MVGEPEIEASESRMFDLARAGGTEPSRAGVPADLANAEGDTLLMPAAYYGHADTLRMLVTFGADLHRVNERGKKPLACAVFKKESAVVRALLDAGCRSERRSAVRVRHGMNVCE
ncbi:ankyrin repeat domain-containing protein [Nonomuraea purpurea]|uniref:Ankyrin repeat domain-containing protein n=1 Tax=Nonomuraea purpurea TaxID=1849276 RepID=A0ABV8G0K8_9ACTN